MALNRALATRKKMAERQLSFSETCDWLRLSRTSGVGPVTFARLIERFGDASTAIANLPELSRRAGGKRPQVSPREEAEAELEALDQFGGRMLPSCDPDYPALLRALDPPPPVISVLGNVSLLSQRACALVGSRNASAIGMRFAGDLARQLGDAGLVVVSGLARGIDGAAHAGAMESGTVAVVAGGVDHVYPPQHADLRQQIITKGAVVSERRLGHKTTARDFPRRNRIISGVSLGTIVVEAAKRSGSLITARYALEQNREVFAAPGSPLDPRAAGSNGLIRQGAHLIENAQDVLDVIEGLRTRAFLEPDHPYAPQSHEPVDEDQMDAAREQVRGLLSPSPVHMDELVRAAGLPAHMVAAALVELELADAAICLPGGMVQAGSSWSL